MSFYTLSHILMLFISWFWVYEFGSARRNITTTQSLRDLETLESSNAIFKFGFFSPINSTYRYVGIWYTKEVANQLKVVWIANRNNPLSDSSGVLKISGDGNLQLLDEKNKSIWSSNIPGNYKVNSSVAQLLDSGNLVLSSSGNIIWQSFDHPTDSMLQNMNMYFDENSTISPLVTSWKSASDPSDGRFTVGINHRRLYEVFIWDGVRPYWRSGPWNGQVLMGIRAMYYFAQVDGFNLENDNKGTVSISVSSITKRLTKYYVLTYDGRLLEKDWQDDKKDWKIEWNSLESECDIYGKCGEFGSCNSNSLPICSCLRGFQPRNDQEWSAGNWSSGCVRRTPLQCANIGGEDDGFSRLRNVKVPDDAEWLESYDEEDCRRKCLRNCSCLAYAYTLGFGCMIWNGSLIDVQNFAPVGPDIFIRLAHSEIGDLLNVFKLSPFV
ncbi:G-type lectin S-receptor-like serine/threonine-protein kinase At1g11330 [Chenopodium quinoa]|uniref:G-type lectin S-receptor-like serine/threonine-protein kinase At1g11330 n=1 Tax=Chenopodium quinoa TaxID=63459 RepID=UPI000B7717C3|nr:G-type lectin S-receptor-like serine/threonine-protein kinase At1g11330 [Chenopodium quinoa]